MVFVAALHGVDLKGTKDKVKVEDGTEDDKGIFDSPENYAKLSPEDRERKTQEMMSRMKMFVKQTGM